MVKTCCEYGPVRKRCTKNCRDLQLLAETEGPEAAHAEAHRQKEAACVQAFKREAASELKRRKRMKPGPVKDGPFKLNSGSEPRYLWPVDGPRDEAATPRGPISGCVVFAKLGCVVYEDGFAIGFNHLDQYVNYASVCTALVQPAGGAIVGAFWDAVAQYHTRGWDPEPRAELAREVHARNHGKAVFVLCGDFNHGMTFEQASEIAAQQSTWTYDEARRAAGLA